MRSGSAVSGAHKVLFKRVIDLLKERGAENILVFGGGTITRKGHPLSRADRRQGDLHAGPPAKSILSTIEQSNRQRVSHRLARRRGELR